MGAMLAGGVEGVKENEAVVVVFKELLWLEDGEGGVRGRW